MRFGHVLPASPAQREENRKAHAADEKKLLASAIRGALSPYKRPGRLSSPLGVAALRCCA